MPRTVSTTSAAAEVPVDSPYEDVVGPGEGDVVGFGEDVVGPGEGDVVGFGEDVVGPGEGDVVGFGEDVVGFGEGDLDADALGVAALDGATEVPVAPMGCARYVGASDGVVVTGGALLDARRLGRVDGTAADADAVADADGVADPLWEDV